MERDHVISTGSLDSQPLKFSKVERCLWTMVVQERLVRRNDLNRYCKRQCNLNTIFLSFRSSDLNN